MNISQQEAVFNEVNEALEVGSILIQVDTTSDKVKVPESCRQDGLILRIGRELTPRIVDLEVTILGIAGTLIFSGVPFQCFIPWDSVVAMRMEDPEGYECECCSAINEIVGDAHRGLGSSDKKLWN